MKIRPYAISHLGNLRYIGVNLYGLTWARYPLLAILVDNIHDETRTYFGICLGPLEVGFFVE